MPFARFRTTRFHLVMATTQMLVGLILFFQPGASSARCLMGGLIPMDSATLVGGGVLLLVSEQLRPSGPWRWLVGLMPALPPAFGAVVAMAGGLWIAGLVYVLMALAVIAGAIAGGNQKPSEGLDLWMLLLGTVQVSCGALFLLGVAPDTLLTLTPIHPFIRLVGVLGLVSGTALLVGSRPQSQTAAFPLYLAVGGLFPTLMAWTSWETGFYAGMAAWGTWAVTLLISPNLFHTGEAEAPEHDETDTFPASLERLLESLMWLLALSVVVTTADDGGYPGGALRSTIFVLALSAYNVLAFRVLRTVGSRAGRLRCHLSFITLSVALLLLHSSVVGHGFLAMLAAIPALGARAGGKREGYHLLVVSVISVGLAGLSTPREHGGLAGMAIELIIYVVSSAVGLYVAAEHRNAAVALARRQRELEEALASARQANAEKARLVEILEATPDVVAMSDTSLRVIYLNQAAKRLVDVNLGESAVEWLIHSDQPHLNDRLALEVLPALVRDGYWAGEDQIRTRTGEIVPVSAVVIPHKETDGEVRCFSYILRDIREQKHYEKQLIHLASYDPLTELFNRRRFCEELDKHLAMDVPGETRGALVFIDVDQFKYVNDTLGHLAGDELLRGLAEVLRQQVRREVDTVARLGGDEFAVILPGTSAEEARVIAERITEKLRRHVQFLAGKPIGSTVSVGVALYPDHGTTAAELLARADMAMYVAKEQGRNRVSFFDPACAAMGQGEQKIHWEQQIRRAIGQERLTLYSQPIWSMAEERVSHCELLLRMVGENGEVISPGEFLPVAERFGLIHEIDRWVVRQAIQVVAEQALRGSDLIVEVNLSGLAFSDPGLLPLIRRELAEHEVNPGSLIFEITETAAIADLKQAEQFITTLRQLGCQFAIDDFGSGYASFTYLKHLPVDYLKIDGSFIANLVRDSVDLHLVRSMVEVARGLGKRTIAEFVGDAETMRVLREIGVDFAQGYYIGRPAPRTE